MWRQLLNTADQCMQHYRLICVAWYVTIGLHVLLRTLPSHTPSLSWQVIIVCRIFYFTVYKPALLMSSYSILLSSGQYCAFVGHSKCLVIPAILVCRIIWHFWPIIYICCMAPNCRLTTMLTSGHYCAFVVQAGHVVMRLSPPSTSHKNDNLFGAILDFWYLQYTRCYARYLVAYVS